MTTTTIPPAETLATGFNESVQAMTALSRMAGGFGEGAFLRAYYTVHVKSEAEVDAAAELWGVKPQSFPDGYRAETAGVSVTVAVAYYGNRAQVTALPAEDGAEA
jgi:hypothetical protein